MFGLFKKTLKIMAPVTGRVVDITEVPDETFSTKLIGNGTAIIPSEGTICAPIDGVVKSIFKTNHAFGIQGENGVELIVHVGVDTVELAGEGFARLIEEGSTVKAGDKVLEVDLELIAKKGYPIITPIIIASATKEENLEISVGQLVTAGKDVIINCKL